MVETCSRFAKLTEAIVSKRRFEIRTVSAVHAHEEIFKVRIGHCAGIMCITRKTRHFQLTVHRTLTCRTD